MTTININSGPHQSKEIEIHDNSVHILVGRMDQANLNC